jgi:hypothetical protein
LLADALSTLHLQLIRCQQRLARRLHVYVWQTLASRLNTSIWEHSIKGQYFSPAGAAQFVCDMNALFTLFKVHLFCCTKNHTFMVDVCCVMGYSRTHQVHGIISSISKKR